MLPLQPRPVPRDRGLGRERDDGRNPAPRIRRRIPRLYPPRQDRGGDGRRGAAGLPPAPGVISDAPRLKRSALHSAAESRASKAFGGGSLRYIGKIPQPAGM